MMRRAVLLNVNEPELRGLALALQTVLDDVGKGLGPFLVAMLITGLGRCVALPCVAAGKHSMMCAGLHADCLGSQGACLGHAYFTGLAC